MSFILNLPPSAVAKICKQEEEQQKDSGTDEPKKKSREDWKKQKELEEARKAGTAPAMQDEEGKDINPHIPQYIMQAPWYFGADAPTLRHQRMQDDTVKKFDGMGSWYKKGVKDGVVATKYRKGACENCGALTHKKRDCLERPRKLGAKFTGEKIAPDEFLQPKLALDYSGKRDRWNGYNPDEHKEVIAEFAKLEDAKKLLKTQKLEETLMNDNVEEIKEKLQPDSDEEDEDKYADDVDMPGQKFESKQRITVRNLRIREDTAKYLYNLDVSSAYYDPKTRSMRENPLKNTSGDTNELPYAGDNFVRHSGDAHNMAKQQMFAWEAYEKGAEVHLQADPTKLELLAQEYKKKRDEFKDSHRMGILEKYGGQEHLEAPPKQLLLAQTEEYVEYSRYGNVIKGQEKAVIKSKFEEDVYPNNHTSVWGSYWINGIWGFKCCYSTVRGSYCTGDKGKDITETAVVPVTEPESQKELKTLVELHQEKMIKECENKSKINKKKKKKQKRRKKKKKVASSSESSSESSESDVDKDAEDELREKRIKEAMKEQARHDREMERILAMDERKRPYNSMSTYSEPTEEEMEAYYRKQKRTDDPMAAFLEN